ncbi:hypothetical protein QR680_017726 [Steinernema hermaphroditum]|uniref:Uncharacterized protein n=1 Tax=Steinernema hermaphroditum TaxID=289476 RepID=A0AA39HFL7_9BILA|nr:hypothetical protein QR680_017726 [Steinernema hermaphroditum]
MPKQDFGAIDMVAPVIVAAVFAVIVFVISFFIINFWCINKGDDITVFEKMGQKSNVRLGRRNSKFLKKTGHDEYEIVSDGKKLIN